MAEFTTGAGEITSAVRRLREAAKTNNQKLKRQTKQLIELEATQLYQQGSTHGTLVLVNSVFENRDPVELRTLAKYLAKREDSVILLGVAGRKSLLVFAAADNVPFEMNLALTQALPFLGKATGGGSGKFAQGGGPAANKSTVTTAVEHARHYILKLMDENGKRVELKPPGSKNIASDADLKDQYDDWFCAIMIEIGDGIFVETGFDGVNVGAIVTKDGIVCIDAPSYPRDARDWVMQLERVHNRPICLLILTDCHGDRILNTRWFHAPIMSHNLAAEQLKSYEKRYPQYLIDSLHRRNPAGGRELAHSPVQWPSLSFSNSVSLHYSPYTIDLTHKAGPAPGSIWIAIQEQGILFLGDSVVSGTLPTFTEMCWYDWMASLRQLASSEDSYKVLVPGRGEIGDANAADDMIWIPTIIEQTVLNYAERGIPPFESD